MKKTFTSLFVAATAFASLGGVASAQENFWDGEIDPYGRVMYDQFGDVHYADPYATDSMVDIYGNVISTDNGQFDPYYGGGDYQHLFTQDPTSSYYETPAFETPSYEAPYVPYAQPEDSHQAFINSIYE